MQCDCNESFCVAWMNAITSAFDTDALNGRRLGRLSGALVVRSSWNRRLKAYAWSGQVHSRGTDDVSCRRLFTSIRSSANPLAINISNARVRGDRKVCTVQDLTVVYFYCLSEISVKLSWFVRSSRWMLNVSMSLNATGLQTLVRGHLIEERSPEI